jgi:hypothetical protein
MAMAETVVSAYHERAKVENWAAWADENPYENALLILAVKDA